MRENRTHGSMRRGEASPGQSASPRGSLTPPPDPVVTLPAKAFYRVKRLCDQRMSDYGIAALTGIPRPTVQRWRHLDEPPGRRYAIHEEWRPADPEAYCYLLVVSRRRKYRSPSAERMDFAHRMRPAV